MNTGKTAAILTHWGSMSNYGQQLQTFALQLYLHELGIKPTLIRYMGEGQALFVELRPFINKYILSGFCPSKAGEDPRCFREFQEKYLNYSKKRYMTYHSLKAIGDSYDFYITGSDQVWGKYLIAPGFLGNRTIDAYCLSFRGSGRSGFSYAASFGFSSPSKSHAKRFSKQLNKLDSISVREEAGLSTLKSLGVGGGNGLQIL